jgi:hypothetical protein
VSQNGVSTATSLGSGNAYNGAASYNVNVKIWNSTSVRMQNNATSSSMQGGNFNDPTREINISFCYAVDES